MKRNKFKAILSIMAPVGAAAEMLPSITPADLIKDHNKFPTKVFAKQITSSKLTPETCAPMGKRVTPRNRNILSSTKPIR